MPLVFQRQERSLWSVTQDISTGGLFLQSCSPPDVGEELEIRLPDPWTGGSLVLRGEVVYRRGRNQAALLGNEPARLSGAGVAFKELSSDQRDRLKSILSLEHRYSEEFFPRVKPAEAREEDEGNCAFQLLEDPVEIRKVFDGITRRIRPVRLKRLGGQIHYTTYFPGVIRAGAPLRVQAEAVRFKDFDSAFSEKVPFVFSVDLEEHVFLFSLTERPRAMEAKWSFPLPSRIYRRTDRRTPRYGKEVKHPLTVEFPDPSDAGLQRVKNVLDISYGGLAFKNYPGEEAYCPGQSLSEVKICDFDHVCWKTDGVVRHTAFVCLPNGEVFQKVGMEFAGEGSSTLEEVPSVKEGELERIEALSTIQRHLEKVASTRVKILTGLDHSILFSDGRLRAEKRNGGVEITISSDLLSHGKEMGFTEERLTFHYLYHGTYHFFSARTRKKNGLLLLEVPTVINRARRRKVVRIRPDGIFKPRFRCFHPVLGRKITFPVRDFSIRGLSFESDYARDLFWRGIRLRSCEILLGDEYYPLGGLKIRSLVQTATENGEWARYCGVEFLDLPADTERRISGYIFSKNNPQIRAPAAERIKSLWDLFNRSGFIYPSKMAYIRKIRPEIDRTWKKLLSDDIGFYKQIVFREGEEELATASAVQVYENTWLFQHLAASSHPVKLITKYVMLGLAHFLMENRNTKYLITYFRKENSFPRKVYSGFLDRYPSEEQFCFGKYSFLSLDLEESGRPGDRQQDSAVHPSDRIVVGYPADGDKEIIENYFEKRLHPLLIRSRSLSRDALHLPETSAMFRAKGLKRERSCLVARQGGTMIAFALLENSSAGINLSGLLNGFSLYTVCSDHPMVTVSRRRLLEAVLDRYRSWDERVAICLTEEEDLTDYLDAGFVKEKEYICLSWSRIMIKNYYDYVQERFSRFEERKQRVSTEGSHPGDSM